MVRQNTLEQERQKAGTKEGQMFFGEALVQLTVSLDRLPGNGGAVRQKLPVMRKNTRKGPITISSVKGTAMIYNNNAII